MSDSDLEPGELQDDDDGINVDNNLSTANSGDTPKIIFGSAEQEEPAAPVNQPQPAVIPDVVSFTGRREPGPTPAQTSSSSYAQYRSAPTRQNYDSDSSGLESDEDTPMWDRKRAKYMASKTRETNMEVTSPEKQERGDSAKTSRGKFSSNNIWGAILQEQDLTQDLGGVGMKKISKQNRNVETYDYTNALNDTRPRVERHSDSDHSDSHDVFATALEPEDCTEVKKKWNKRSVKSRLGKRKISDRGSKHYQPLSTVTAPSAVTAESSDRDVVNWLANALDEPKKRLLYVVVETIGKEIPLKVAKEAIDLDEEGGGMMTQDGSRRRTKGGVFFQLLRTTDGVSKNKLNKIRQANWNMDAKANRQHGQRQNRQNKDSSHANDKNGRHTPEDNERMDSTTTDGNRIADETDSSSDEEADSSMKTESTLGCDVGVEKSLECMEDEIILE